MPDIPKRLESAEGEIVSTSEDILEELRTKLEKLKKERESLETEFLTKEASRKVVVKGEIDTKKRLDELTQREGELVKRENDIKNSLSELRMRINKLSRIYGELRELWKRK